MSFAIGYLYPSTDGKVHQDFMDSIIRLLTHDAKPQEGGRGLFRGYFNSLTAYIPDGRNKLCETFLEFSDADWLLMVDFDVVFDPEMVYKLYDAANHKKYPIIAGIYVTWFGDDSQLRPCWMKPMGDDEFCPVGGYTPEMIEEMSTVGMGFTMISRKALIKMKKAYKDDPWHWFGHDQIGKDRVGEDITFCNRARKIGLSVWGHGGVVTGHIKSKTLTVQDMDTLAPFASKLGKKVDKKILNVGGGRGTLAPEYANWSQLSVDIDPKANPDFVADARDLSIIQPKSYDAIYCSHNLEHYTPEEVPVVLKGFKRILKSKGFVDIRVPDIGEVKKHLKEGKRESDVAYVSPSGPIKYSDIINGWSKEIDAGNEYFRHKTGFTSETITKVLKDVGFKDIKVVAGNFQLSVLGVK